MSANPNSFEDSLGRVGPDIHGNRLLDNSVNGLFIRIESQAGVPLQKLEVPARWNDRDVVHVVTENLQLAGAPGGPLGGDEIQQLAISGAPVGGETFTLTFDGQTTKPIAVNAPANVNTNEIQQLIVPCAAVRAFCGFRSNWKSSGCQSLAGPARDHSGSASRIPAGASVCRR